MRSELSEFWTRLWHRVKANGNAESVAKDLFARYSEPERAYHTLDHIAHCFTELADIHGLLVNPDAVEFALWFHDAVYDSRRHDNEERSAVIARNAAQNAGLSEPFIDLVTKLILATKHTSSPSSADERHIVDIDLSILGRPASVFDEYERRIRQEYRWVADDAFVRGRRAILSSFLSRPNIFSTDVFRAKYESSARENLARSMSALGE